MDSRTVETGQRYDRLTVLKVHRKDGRGDSFLCRCDCGNEVVLCRSYLLGAKNRNPNISCGCIHHKQQGLCVQHRKLYAAWKAMIARCYKECTVRYERYGGNGITVCDEWLNSFESFLNWALASGYSEWLTIDRIDGSKGYSPDNCRLVDYYVQAQNRCTFKNNKSGVNGVTKDKSTGHFRAYITRMGVTLNLGSYDNLSAAKSERERAEKYFDAHGTLSSFA